MNQYAAVLRIGLGLAQVMAATVAVCFLLATGTSQMTIWATVVTLFFVTVSKVIHARADSQ